MLYIPFKEHKSTGPFSIPSIILIKCRAALAIPLHSLFRKILQESNVPEQFKLNRITPVHKSGKPKADIDSYRPIGVASNIAGIFDNIIINRLDSHIFSIGEI